MQEIRSRLYMRMQSEWVYYSGGQPVQKNWKIFYVFHPK